MRPLTNVEKAILAILVAALIIGGGGFLFVWPQIQQISVVQKQIADVEAKEQTYITNLARESTIDNEILDAYKIARQNSEHFYPIMNTYEMDRVVRAFTEEAGYTIDTLIVSPMSTYSFDTVVVSAASTAMVYDPLSQYAISVNEMITSMEGGNEQAAQEETVTEPVEEQLNSYGITDETLETYLATAQTVGSFTATFSIEASKSELREFLDFIKNYDKCVILNSYQIPTKASALTSTSKSNYSFVLYFLCCQPVVDTAVFGAIQ